MLTFKQFLLEAQDTKTGNYVQLDSEFPDFVDDISISSGCKSRRAHITLVYSKEQTQDVDKILKLMNKEFDDSGEADFDRAACFDGEGDTACVVLKLRSDVLHRMHNRLIQIGDIVHSYDEFSPHLTIFYDVDRAEAHKLAAHINKNYRSLKIKFQGFDSTTIIQDWQT